MKRSLVLRNPLATPDFSLLRQFNTRTSLLFCSESICLELTTPSHSHCFPATLESTKNLPCVGFLSSSSGRACHLQLSSSGLWPRRSSGCKDTSLGYQSRCTQGSPQSSPANASTSAHKHVSHRISFKLHDTQSRSEEMAENRPRQPGANWTPMQQPIAMTRAKKGLGLVQRWRRWHWLISASFVHLPHERMFQAV